MQRTAKLALSDGTVLTGDAFGAEGEVFGEVVFNTSMTGYQEILTDPSYFGQLVAMTYPQIGNYGVNVEDVESNRIAARAFIVRELCRTPSNYRSAKSLDQYLAEHGVIGLEGIDTRALVRRLRVAGRNDRYRFNDRLGRRLPRREGEIQPELSGHDYVREVMPAEKQAVWESGLNELVRRPEGAVGKEFHVVAVDYGMKWNIPRHLREMGCRVTVVPGTATADDILALNPDGVFLSNGPGDPRPLDYAIETIRQLLGKKPVFGICLGHQLLGLAAGAEIFKLKFGHRGANQPVINKSTGKVEITSQNHGFALVPDTMPADVEVTHVNLNDGTVAGIRHKNVPAFGVQYHPEASAGPHDSDYLFAEFRRLMS